MDIARDVSAIRNPGKYRHIARDVSPRKWTRWGAKSSALSRLATGPRASIEGQSWRHLISNGRFRKSVLICRTDDCACPLRKMGCFVLKLRAFFQHARLRSRAQHAMIAYRALGTLSRNCTLIGDTHLPADLSARWRTWRVATLI